MSSLGTYGRSSMSGGPPVGEAVLSARGGRVTEKGSLSMPRTAPMLRGASSPLTRSREAGKGSKHGRVRQSERSLDRARGRSSMNGRLMDAEDVRRAITRIAHEILERDRGAEGLALVGIADRGDQLAARLVGEILRIEGAEVSVG